MQCKFLIVLFGIVLLAINAIATLLAFNVTGSFLGFMPTNLAIYLIADAVLAILMIILGVNPNTY
jgi:uncharacterized membrane protein